MSKHTPGPWVAKQWFDLDHEGEERAELWEIAVKYGAKIPLSSLESNDLETVAANARLIAAAPELLEALRGLLAACEGAQFASDPFDAVDIARAALAKANGEGSR